MNNIDPGKKATATVMGLTAMKSKHMARRFLEALTDSTPAFTPRRLESTNPWGNLWHRFLVASTDAGLVFRSNKRLDEYTSFAADRDAPVKFDDAPGVASDNVPFPNQRDRSLSQEYDAPGGNATDINQILVGVIGGRTLYRWALVQVLRDTPGFGVGVVASSVTEFAEGGQPSGGLVVMAIELSDLAGVTAIRKIVEMGHRVLVMGANASTSEVVDALTAGASGYLLKDDDDVIFADALRSIVDGGLVVSETLELLDLVRYLAARIRTNVTPSDENPVPRMEPAVERLLTPGEVATLFRVDPKTVARWVKAGRLNSIRVPGGHRRFRESDVKALLAELVSTMDEKEANSSDSRGK